MFMIKQHLLFWLHVFLSFKQTQVVQLEVEVPHIPFKGYRCPSYLGLYLQYFPHFCQIISSFACFKGVCPSAELRNVKFFTQTKIWVQNVTPKTRNSQLICFRDKTRKSWSIQVVVGLVCYVRHPIGYLHRIWVECKCAWVKITPLKYRI